MKIEYENTFFDLLKFNTSHQFRNIIVQVFFILIVSFVFYMQYVSAKNEENNIIIALIMAVFVYALMWLVQLIFNVFYLYSKKNKMLLTNHIVEIQKDSLYEETPYSKAFYYWNGVTKVIKIAGFIAIYLTPYMAIIVPSRAFKTKEQQKNFFNLAKEYIKKA